MKSSAREIKKVLLISLSGGRKKTPLLVEWMNCARSVYQYLSDLLCLSDGAVIERNEDDILC